MVTVVNRCKEIARPSQYISMRQFEEFSYEPSAPVQSIMIHSSLQGMAVDYLTRLYLGEPLEKAFAIPLKGAKIKDAMESKVQGTPINENSIYARKLLNKINNKELDDSSVAITLNLVQYDQYYRTEHLSPNFRDFIETSDSYIVEDIQTIKELVRRSITFFSRQNIIKTGFTFDGGYTELVTEGDGDIASTSTLWDIKTFTVESEIFPYNKRPYGKIKPAHALQVLIYYLLGIHSDFRFFKGIRYIGLYNPITNKAFRLEISKIPKKNLYKVSHEVIGYKMLSDSYEDWKKVDGTDEEILIQREKLKQDNVPSAFNADSYKDGIYRITKGQYLMYLYTIRFYPIDYSYNPRTGDIVSYTAPRFSRVHNIYYIKRGKYKMFVSESESGKLQMLYGAKVTGLNNSKEYYYDHLTEYAEQVLNVFGKYWRLLYNYSEVLKRNSFDSGVHGNIIDLSFSEHLYVNPLNLSIQAYTATSMVQKYFYKTPEKMIKETMPDKLDNYVRAIKNETPELLKLETNQSMLKSLITDEELEAKRRRKTKYELIEGIQTSKDTRRYVKSTNMYKASNRLRALQYVYDNGLVVLWDNFIFDSINKKRMK